MPRRDDAPTRTRSRHTPLTLAVVGAALLIAALAKSGFHGLDSGIALAGLICLGLGAAAFAEKFLIPQKLPKNDVLRLAESKGGILTLSETASALNIDPDLAAKTLVALSKTGIAHQQWQEFRKNVWEFPDYIKLPISQTLSLAKQNGGRISLDDLLASGQSPDTARQTLDTLSQTGLAHPDPAAATSALLLTTPARA